MRDTHRIQCETCDGTGRVRRFPYYATIMPKEKEMDCSDCNGKGELLVIDTDLPIVIGGR